MDLQAKYDDLLIKATELAQYASYAEKVNGISVNRAAIQKSCAAIFEISKEEERLEEVKLNFEHPYTFRETPKSIQEMLDWGMINQRIYDRVSHLESSEAMKEVYANYGIQTWSFGEHHIREYIVERNLKPTVDFADANAFIGHCIKLAKGRMNPVAATVVWKEYANSEKATQ